MQLKLLVWAYRSLFVLGILCGLYSCGMSMANIGRVASCFAPLHLLPNTNKPPSVCDLPEAHLTVSELDKNLVAEALNNRSLVSEGYPESSSSGNSHAENVARYILYCSPIDEFRKSFNEISFAEREILRGKLLLDLIFEDFYSCTRSYKVKIFERLQASSSAFLILIETIRTFGVCIVLILLSFALRTFYYAKNKT